MKKRNRSRKNQLCLSIERFEPRLLLTGLPEFVGPADPDPDGLGTLDELHEFKSGLLLRESKSFSLGPTDSYLGYIDQVDSVVIDLLGPEVDVVSDDVIVNGEHAYFVARSSTGIDLWKSDATSEGTVRVLNIIDDPEPQFIGASMVGIGDTFFFGMTHAGTIPQDTAVWQSDGTSEGTRALVSFSDSLVADLVEIESGFLFRVFDEGFRASLWQSDGTVNGTTKFHESSLTTPRFGKSFGSQHLFHDQSGLWITDGTESGTEIINEEVRSPAQFIEHLDQVYFVAETTASQPQLWRTNGTVEGTVRITELEENSHSVYQNPAVVGTLDQQLFFGSGNALWSVDETDAVRLVESSIVVKSTHSSTRLGTDFGDNFYFAADDGETGFELWKTNGLTAEIVADLNPNETNSNPLNLTVIDDSLYFSARTPELGFGLWVIHATEPQVGDFDSDGDIDVADRTVLAQNWTGALANGEGDRTFAQGDADGDGDVDAADATLLTQGWTGARLATTHLRIAQVPELQFLDDAPNETDELFGTRDQLEEVLQGPVATSFVLL